MSANGQKVVHTSCPNKCELPVCNLYTHIVHVVLHVDVCVVLLTALCVLCIVLLIDLANDVSCCLDSISTQCILKVQSLIFKPNFNIQCRDFNQVGPFDA